MACRDSGPCLGNMSSTILLVEFRAHLYFNLRAMHSGFDNHPLYSPAQHIVLNSFSLLNRAMLNHCDVQQE